MNVSISGTSPRLLDYEADAKGKADWQMNLAIKDQAGEVSCLLQGVWQMRRAGT